MKRENSSFEFGFFDKSTLREMVDLFQINKFVISNTYIAFHPVVGGNNKMIS